MDLSDLSIWFLNVPVMAAKIGDRGGDGDQREISDINDKYPDAEESQMASILPWDRFSNWIHCICIVTFDLELGQAMEVNRTRPRCGTSAWDNKAQVTALSSHLGKLGNLIRFCMTYIIVLGLG